MHHCGEGSQPTNRSTCDGRGLCAFRVSTGEMATMSPMTSFRLLFRSLRFYWQTNVAVVLGVVAATAVIGGALIVGDSVRDSLRKMTLDRLGDVNHALVAQRFFTEQRADFL